MALAVKQAFRIAKNAFTLPYLQVWYVVRRGGVRLTHQMVGDYLRTVVRQSRRAPHAREIRAVMFLSGCPGGAKRYRCDHQAEQLQMLGATCAVGVYGHTDLGDTLHRHQCFILQRVPHGPDVECFIEQARQRGKVVIFDTDDWVFDPGAAPYVAALEGMTEPERTLYREGLARYRKTLCRCDAVLVTTKALQNLARQLHDAVFIAPNVVSQEMMDHADKVLRRKHADEPDSGAGEKGLTIAYLSGTPTHDRDFLEAAEAVLWALEAYPSVRFKGVGHIQLDSRFQRYAHRVEWIPPQPWQRLPEILAGVDINLAPLERDNPFTESKSCLKYLEAALLGVPTVASARSDFLRAIEHGRNGLLADTPEEWREGLRRLIESPDLRKQIGREAHDDVRRHHVTTTRAGALYETLLDIVDPFRPAPQPLTINWILRAPIPATGGGYRTIFRLAHHLACQGHIVRVYIEPIAHLAHLSANQICAFIEEHFGPLRGEVFVGHDHILPADASIATNWPTANRVAEHGESLFKFYFIQDREPEFYDRDDPLYREAEKTYTLPLQPICIGRHLANWVRGFTGKPAEMIDFAIDAGIFCMKVRPEERRGPIKVLFFARPALKRRGYALGVEALRLLKQARPEADIRFFGATYAELGAPGLDFQNLGVLSPQALAEAMNEAHILLSFSLSNMSWVPFEGMACGCAVVEADLPGVREMVVPGRDCLLVDLEPVAVTAALVRLIDDASLRCDLGNQAAAAIGGRSWQETARQFEEILVRRCFVRLA